MSGSRLRRVSERERLVRLRRAQARLDGPDVAEASSCFIVIVLRGREARGSGRTRADVKGDRAGSSGVARQKLHSTILRLPVVLSPPRDPISINILPYRCEDLLRIVGELTMREEELEPSIRPQRSRFQGPVSRTPVNLRSIYLRGYGSRKLTEYSNGQAWQNTHVHQLTTRAVGLTRICESGPKGNRRVALAVPQILRSELLPPCHEEALRNDHTCIAA